MGSFNLNIEGEETSEYRRSSPRSGKVISKHEGGEMVLASIARRANLPAWQADRPLHFKAACQVVGGGTPGWSEIYGGSKELKPLLSKPPETIHVVQQEFIRAPRQFVKDPRWQNSAAKYGDTSVVTGYIPSYSPLTRTAPATNCLMLLPPAGNRVNAFFRTFWPTSCSLE